VRARIALLSLAVVGLSASCNASNVPGFCGASDKVRLAIADVDPAQYPAEAAKHVQELKDSASGLSGAQGKLANKVVKDLQAASESAPKSLAFTDTYNKFVSDSNEFDHKYCNETEGPDF
jgi:hypothetical protein